MTNTVLDKKLLENGFAELDSEDQKALILSERNRWFVAFLIVSGILLISIFMSFIFANKAVKNTEFIYVKMYKDGSWEVDVAIPDGKRPLLKNVIDANFGKYLKARYGQRPSSIRQDYAEAVVFMSESMYANFVSEDKSAGGFDAINKANEIQIDPNAEIKKIKFNFSDHYDLIEGVIDGERGHVYRSNLHFVRITQNDSGVTLGKPEKLILRVQWRLLPMDDMKEKSRKWLRVNPLGIELIDDELLIDPSA